MICQNPDCNNPTKILLIKKDIYRKFCCRSCSSKVNSKNNKHYLGKTHSQETREKISKINTGKKRSDAAKDNIRQSLLGKKHSKERVENHSKRMLGNDYGKGGLGWGHINTKTKKGVPLSETHKENLSKSLKGKIRTDETKKKMSDSASKREFTGSSLNNYHIIGDIKCQGGSEKKYIENLIKENKNLPTKPLYIQTPFGRRLLDFEYDDYFVEIKSNWTYSLYINSDQEIKDKWISDNIKPVKVIII